MITVTLLDVPNPTQFVGAIRIDGEIVAHYEHRTIMGDGEVQLIVAPVDVLADCTVLTLWMYTKAGVRFATTKDSEGRFFYGECRYARCTAVQEMLARWAQAVLA